MAAWVLKGGKAGEREQRMLDHGCVAVGWEELGDLSSIGDRESLVALYRATYADAPEGRVPNHVGQLFRFAHQTKPTDLVVVPMKTSATIAIGEITGEYRFRDDFGPDMAHTLPVKWLRTDIPRSTVDQDLLHTFGTLLTVSRAERNNAENRIRKMVSKNGIKPALLTPTSNEPLEEDGNLQDIEEQARDQILGSLGANFGGTISPVS